MPQRIEPHHLKKIERYLSQIKSIVMTLLLVISYQCLTGFLRLPDLFNVGVFCIIFFYGIYSIFVKDDQDTWTETDKRLAHELEKMQQSESSTNPDSDIEE